MRLNLDQKLMCVRHAKVVEDNEVKTKVEHIGSIKGHVIPKNNSISLYFHANDREMVEQSRCLLWLRQDGTRVGLVPTMEMSQENQKFMKLKTSSMRNNCISEDDSRYIMEMEFSAA